MAVVKVEAISAQITNWSADRVTSVLKDAGCDAIVGATVPNVFYLTGYSSLSHRLLGRVPVFAILTKEGTKHLITPSSDCDLVAMHQPRIDTLNLYGSFFVAPAAEHREISDEERFLSDLLPSMRGDSDWLDAFGTAMRKEKLESAHVLLDEEGLTPAQFDSICTLFANATFRLGSELLRGARSVKSPVEVELLRKASAITEQAITSALGRMQQGSTDADLHREFQLATIQQGARPFFEVIASGSRTSMSNAEPTGHPLESNRVIRFDVGCKYMMYCSDIARNAAFGEVSPEIRRYYQAILAGEEKGLETIKPGVSAAALFHVIVDAVRENGIPRYERHHCGHGIGLEGYETPLIAPQDETVLEQGMVLCIETPYYELGLGGLQVEDMVVVTDDGCELLTQLDRQILTV